MATLVNKQYRELKELENLFSDPKYARQAWKAVGTAIARNPVARPLPILDKDGNQTIPSCIEQYSYDKLRADLKQLGEPNREPTELEMIMQCQMVKARYDTNAAVFVRDTLGAKPVDESKVEQNVVSQYENLTDEELELIAKHREIKARIEAPDASPETSEASSAPDSLVDNGGVSVD